jgi:hypothetical protein
MTGYYSTFSNFIVDMNLMNDGMSVLALSDQSEVVIFDQYAGSDYLGNIFVYDFRVIHHFQGNLLL